jgi:two-component system, chemotaxis family, protein-glutamate methylesterase/glutaminase
MRLVAVGCSWGGLSALSRLFNALPGGLDAAVVVAQHRGPEESRLRSMLHGRSRLPVHEAEDKDELRPGRIFLAPPGYHVLVEPGRLALSTEAPVNFARPSLDVLFESAADAYGPRCVGVVLTGASSDGAEGLRRICEAGGAAIVQQPETAERPEMPAAALLAVPSARILPLEAIPEAIAELCEVPV